MPKDPSVSGISKDTSFSIEKFRAATRCETGPTAREQSEAEAYTRARESGEFDPSRRSGEFRMAPGLFDY